MHNPCSPWITVGRLALALLLACVVAAPAAAAPPDVPRPLRSKDLQKWMKDLEPGDAQRTACERAFDAYVEQWEPYRDQTVRPAQAKRDASDGDAAAEAAWRSAVARALDSVARFEGSMFDAMRAAPLNAEQAATLERIAAARARQRAGGVVRGLPLNLPAVPGLAALPAEARAAVDRRLREWELSATPLIERLAAASLDDKAADREQELRRKVLAGERAAVNAIAALLPAEASSSFKDAFRRQALSRVGAWGNGAWKSPASVRSQLDAEHQREALARIDQWQKQREALEEAALDALTGDASAADALAQLETKYGALNESSLADIASAAGKPELAASGPGLVLDLGDMDGGAIDVGELADLGPGEGGAMVFSSVNIVAGDGGPGDAAHATQSMVVIRGDGAEGAMAGEGSMRTLEVHAVSGDDAPPGEIALRAGARSAAEASAAAAGDAIASAMGEKLNQAIASTVMGSPDELPGSVAVADGHREGSLGLRPLGRQDVDALRQRLFVAESRRPIWEALASDLMQSNTEWLKGEPERAFPILVGAELVEHQKKQRERIDALVKLEDAWFDAVKTTVPGVEETGLERERNRRALDRAFAVVRGMAMPMPEVMMSRWGRVNLYKAAESLSPAAAALVMPSIDRWCVQMRQELALLPQRLADFDVAQRAHMNITSSEDGDGKATMSFLTDEQGAAEIDRLRKPILDMVKMVERTQAESAEAVAQQLDADDAKVFRRAVRRQTHPEVFRTQERVAQAVDRVRALPSLSPDQAKAVATLVQDYDARCDALIERSIEHTDRSDAGIAKLMQGAARAANRQDGMRDVRAMQVAQRMRGDTAYDREELNARALRQLRAVLTAEQAKAARVN